MYTNASTCIGHHVCKDYRIVIAYLYIHNIYNINHGDKCCVPGYRSNYKSIKKCTVRKLYCVYISKKMKATERNGYVQFQGI